MDVAQRAQNGAQYIQQALLGDVSGAHFAQGIAADVVHHIIGRAEFPESGEYLHNVRVAQASEHSRFVYERAQGPLENLLVIGIDCPHVVVAYIAKGYPAGIVLLYHHFAAGDVFRCQVGNTEPAAPDCAFNSVVAQHIASRQG